MTGGMTDGSGSGEGAALPPLVDEAYLARFLRPNYWRRSAAGSKSWRTSYDGPLAEECARLGVRYYPEADDYRCGEPCSDWLGIEAYHTCVDMHGGPVRRAEARGGCASHVTLITNRLFATNAAARIACFVEERLGDDREAPNCTGHVVGA